MHFIFTFCFVQNQVFLNTTNSPTQFNSTQLISIHILPNDHIRARPRPQNIFSLVQSTCNLQISSKAASSGKRMTLDHSHCPRLCPIDRHGVVVVVVPCPFTRTVKEVFQTDVFPYHFSRNSFRSLLVVETCQLSPLDCSCTVDLIAVTFVTFV